MSAMAAQSTGSGGVGSVTLRPAVLGDSHRVWVWRNDPETRHTSFQPDPIPLEVHEEWFRTSLVPHTRRVYVVVADGTESGVIALDLSGGDGEVSVYLAPEWRYASVAPGALRALATEAFGALGVRRLLCSIRPDDQVSLAAFASAGFALVGGSHAVTALLTDRRS
jgi:RimJ/RimL family protein N-acetyltransferase